MSFDLLVSENTSKFWNIVKSNKGTFSVIFWKKLLFDINKSRLIKHQKFDIQRRASRWMISMFHINIFYQSTHSILLKMSYTLYIGQCSRYFHFLYVCVLCVCVCVCVLGIQFNKIRRSDIKNRFSSSYKQFRRTKIFL